MRTDGANLFHVHDDRVTRLAIYHDRERALARAVGVSVIQSWRAAVGTSLALAARVRWR